MFPNETDYSSLSPAEVNDWDPTPMRDWSFNLLLFLSLYFQVKTTKQLKAPENAGD